MGTNDSGVRGRTRRAILAAAASVLARDRSATLAQIADAAGVGRSTLHRYFPDRDELVAAVIEDSLAAIERSVQDAALDQGPPREAMRRLVAAMLENGDRLMFLWGDPNLLAAYEPAVSDDCPEPPPQAGLELIRRGQAEGVFDPGLDPEWIQQIVWAVVYTGVEQVDRGLISRHGVYAAVVRTLENGIRPPGS
ncbi:TetR/AcrR family transcriptional regulator [Bailinhaonella thermotolerans]|uniref:TetR/AcrR family transcriptional regulator n=1 Tax=Bailinhaonella thermotolerans TaxID=1070861 RepID=A0A3A4AF35_9ACTN|nr:TetR/AcrR family transcriptional regulator [Bailinhaonella thermotolerans]RJL27265.1 TetR/AcrR family transcriptional regulator [Bailinhaonella thermotolerans]